MKTIEYVILGSEGAVLLKSAVLKSSKQEHTQIGQTELSMFEKS